MRCRSRTWAKSALVPAGAKAACHRTNAPHAATGAAAVFTGGGKAGPKGAWIAHPLAVVSNVTFSAFGSASGDAAAAYGINAAYNALILYAGTVADCTVTGCVKLENSSAVWLMGGTLSRCQIRDNYAESKWGDDRGGGIRAFVRGKYGKAGDHGIGHPPQPLEGQPQRPQGALDLGVADRGAPGVDHIGLRGRGRDGRDVMMLRKEDGQRQAFAIKEYRDLSGLGARTMPDGVYVSDNTLVYECKICVFDRLRLVRLYYTPARMLWKMTG